MGAMRSRTYCKEDGSNRNHRSSPSHVSSAPPEVSPRSNASTAFSRKARSGIWIQGSLGRVNRLGGLFDGISRVGVVR